MKKGAAGDGKYLNVRQLPLRAPGQDALQEIYDATAESCRQTQALTQTEAGINSPQDVAPAETNLAPALTKDGGCSDFEPPGD